MKSGSPLRMWRRCRVSQNTKKSGYNASRYVGEMGIGFESLLDAADVVWIVSGSYE